MYCGRCGSQIPEGSMFCPVCGASVQQSEGQQGGASYDMPPVNNFGYQPFSMEADRNSVAAKIRKMLSSNLFLAICILLTVPAIPVGGLPVLSILFAIGAWIAYAQARSSDATMQLTGLNMLSGTMTASYVITWIGVGCSALGGVLMAITGPAMNSMYYEIMDEFENQGLWEMIEEEGFLLDAELQEYYFAFWDFFLNNLGMVFTVMAVFILILAVVMAVYNAVFYGRFRRLAKNMGAAYITNNPTVLNFRGMSGMLMAVGIIKIIFAAGDLFGGYFMSGLGGICGGIAFIMASSWVKKLKESFEAPAEPVVNAEPQSQSFDINV